MVHACREDGARSRGDFHIPFVVEVFLARQVISPLHFSQNRKIRGLVEIGVLVQGNNYNL